jgi:RHS repeat-associated protein
MKITHPFILAAAAALSFSTAHAQQPCGNGQASSPSTPDRPDQGGDPFTAYAGNDHREVPDLAVNGAVGDLGLTFRRYSTSRASGSVQMFGQGSNWRHNYQWEMVTSGTNSSGQPQLTINYPDGTINEFTQVSPTEWRSAPSVQEVLIQDGTRYTLKDKQGVKRNFQKLGTTSVYYQLQDIVDSRGNAYTLTYDNGKRLQRVTEPAGRYLELNYATLPINKVDFANLATINSTPVAGQWVELNVTNTTAWRYLRYYGYKGSYSAIAEMEFYDAYGNKLSGTSFGTNPARSSGNEYDKAVDGDPATWFEYNGPSGGYVGIDLGANNAMRVAKVRFLAPAGMEGRMKYGVFQGSNEKPQNITVIDKVVASDGRSTGYNFQSFDDPTLPIKYQNLRGVDYGDGAPASYTYTQALPSTRPLIGSAVEPRYPLAYGRVINTYMDGSSNAIGTIAGQFDYETGAPLASLGIAGNDSHKPKVTYANGRTETFTMNSLGMLQSKADSTGAVTRFTYDQDGAGFLTTTTDAIGRMIHRVPSTLNNDLSRTLPDGATIMIGRDADDRILTYTNEKGHTTAYTRDGFGRVTQTTYADGSTESWSYNQFGQPLTHTLVDGGGTEVFDYDPQGRKRSFTDAMGNTTSYTYNSYDQLASITDPRGNKTSYEYNLRGLISKQVHPDGTFIAYEYDWAGNLSKYTNELGQSWVYVYDQYKRLLSSTDPLGQTTSYTYAAPYENLVQTITAPSGKQTRFAYDVNGRRISQTIAYGTPLAATTTYRYDAVGQMLSNTDPKGGVWSYTYDARGRTASMTDPLGNKTSFTYDAAGNKLTETRADGGITSFEYDSMNRLTKVTDPKGQVTSMTYDQSGNLLSVTDPKNSTYQYTYDLMNRRTAMIYPDSSQERLTYDTAGNLATYTNRAGNVCTYVYDSRNRNIGFSWNDGITPAVAKTYDAASRLLTSNNNASSLSFTYDAANQLLSETQTIVSGPGAKTVAYTYDMDGNRSMMTYPNGVSLAYSYNAWNMFASISAGGPPPLVTYGYDRNGNRTSRSLENGTSAAYSHDAANRLTGLVHSNGGATPFASFSHGFSKTNNRSYVKREDGKGDVFRYDVTDQVTGVDYNATSPEATPANPERTVSYTYDANGNRMAVNENGATESYVTNQLNQYTSIAGGALGYDANGNLSSTSVWNYTYDAQNRLIGATNGVTVASFAYDAMNRCVSRTMDGVTQYLIYDGWHLIQEHDQAGAEAAHYIYGAAVDELLCMVNASGAHYYHQDSMGSVARITNGSGAVEESYSYDLFGAAVIKDGAGTVIGASAIGNRFMFTGREYLQGIGLYDYRNRIYSAQLGRFLQTDPIRFLAGDVNLYRYVGNNAANWIDPSGLSSLFGPPSGFIDDLSRELLGMDPNSQCKDGAANDPFQGGSGEKPPEEKPPHDKTDPNKKVPVTGEPLRQGGDSGGDDPWWFTAIDVASVLLAAADIAAFGPTGEGIGPALALQGMKQGVKQASKKAGQKIGGSGKPVSPTVKHPTRKRAQDAAQAETAKGQAPTHHGAQKGNPPHYHGTDHKGNPKPTHHDYPKQ